MKLLRNIVNNSNDPKFKSFKAKNKIIAQNILQLNGSRDILVQLGVISQVKDFEEIFVFKSIDTEQGMLRLRQGIQVFEMALTRAEIALADDKMNRTSHKSQGNK